MFDKASFEIIGRVGSVKKFDNVVRVSIATDASYKDNGQWVKKTRWNEVTIFAKGLREWIGDNLGKGQWVRAAGVIQQNSYEKDGETRYTTDLIVEDFGRLPVKRDGDADEDAGR